MNTQTLNQTLMDGIKAHELGDFTLAENNYKKVLTSCPQDPDANHALGLLCVSREEYAEASVFLKTALGARPDSDQIRHDYLSAVVASGDSDAATIGLADWLGILEARVLMSVAQSNADGSALLEPDDVVPVEAEGSDVITAGEDLIVTGS